MLVYHPAHRPATIGNSGGRLINIRELPAHYPN